jgi:vitamin B12 transporter
MMSLPVFIALALIVCPAAMLAQEVGDTTRLEELVVTATRAPTPADAVVSSVTTITSDELRSRGIHFVQDALRDAPGASVVQAGSYGGVSSLFLRGGESDYVKVLVDGVPVNQSGGAYNWANLTTDNVERIEILRGPGSVIYGSDAVTGVVQIFTRRGTAGIAVDGGAEAGTFGSVNGHAGLLGGTRAVSYSVDASRLSTDGIYPFNNEYGNTVLSGSLKALPDPRSDLSLVGRFSDSRYHFPTDFAGVLADSNQSNGEKALSVGVDAGRRFGDRYELRLMAGGSRTEGAFDDPPDNPGDTLGFGFASHRKSRGTRGNVDLRLLAVPSSSVRLTVGGQIERETERQSGETTSNFGGIATTPDTPFDRGRTTLGYYVQAVADLPSGLALNLNARLDHNGGFGTFFTYRAGAVYRLPARTRVRASIGRAFKAPTFCEQFCNAPFVVGDSSLRPERSRSWEVGLEHELLPGGDLSLWATYFDQQFRDMILYDAGAAPGEPTYLNGAAAQARGVETGVTSSPGRVIEVSASYTYLAAEATDDGGMPSPTFSSGERLIRRPRHSAGLTLRAQALDRLSVGGSLTYVGPREDVDFNQTPSQRVELDGYAVVDLAAELEIVHARAGEPGISGTVRVENLLDEQYEQVVGFAGRPRAIFGGVRFRL